jgi:hypothetical protein
MREKNFMKLMIDLFEGLAPNLLIAMEVLGVFMVYIAAIFCAILFERWYGARLEKRQRPVLSKARREVGWAKPGVADLSPVWQSLTTATK